MSNSKQRVAKLKAVGGVLCLDFVNTVAWRRGEEFEELLHDYEDLIAWARHVEALSEPEAGGLLEWAESNAGRARRACGEAIALREALYRTFSSLAAGEDPDPADLACIDGRVGDACRHLRLTRCDNGFAWTWWEVEGSLDLPTWKVARSAAELLVSERLSRVRECAGEKCGWLFLDASRNGSRRWCDMADCGNRAKARRNYARRRAERRTP